MTIPESDLSQFWDGKDLGWDQFYEIKRSWFYLIGTDGNGVPKYFGLLALQCYAAYMMQNDGETTAANFRHRFIDLVGIESTDTLNMLFSEETSSNLNMQEIIWKAAQKYLRSHKILIEIPSFTRFKGRYIQFPLSQAILNHEDLKEYLFFYKKIAEKYEIISFDNFKSEYEKQKVSLSNKLQRSNNTKILTAFEERIKVKQIFDFYCSLEWEDLYKEKVKLQLEVSLGNIFAKIKNETICFYDSSFMIMTSYKSIFNEEKFRVFEESNKYPGEYESVNKISKNHNYVIVFSDDKDNISKIEALSTQNIESVKTQQKDLLVYKFVAREPIPKFLQTISIQEYPIKLSGIRIGRKRQYFISNPPQIILKNDDVEYSLFHESKKISPDEPWKVGRYTIRMNGFSKFSFQILNIPELTVNVENASKLLSFQDFSYHNEGDMNGLLIKRSNDASLLDDHLTIRNWIEVNIGSRANSNNKLLRNIINARHGRNK